MVIGALTQLSPGYAARPQVAAASAQVVSGRVELSFCSQSHLGAALSPTAREGVRHEAPIVGGIPIRRKA